MINYESYDKINYNILILLLVFFSFLYLTFLLITLYYIKINNNKNITKLWLDYIITIIIGLIFSITYSINLFINKTKRVKNFEELFYSQYFVLSTSFFILFLFSTITNTIFDIYKSFMISNRMRKLNKIKTKELPQLVRQLKSLDAINILNPKKHYEYISIIYILNIIAVLAFIVSYTNINIQKQFFTIEFIKNYLLKYYNLFLFILLIICILTIRFQKKNIINKDYHSQDRFIMKIYNINLNQIIYSVDILFLKIIADLIINIPLIFFISLQMFNTFALIIFLICLFLFIIIGGNILLTIDYNNNYKNLKKIIVIPRKLRKIFCFKNIHFHLVDNYFNLFMNDYEYYSKCSKYEKKILTDLNINFLGKKDNENEYINPSEEANNIIEDKSFEENNSEFDTISEYYTVYKLLYIFFDRNKKLYDNLLKKIKKYGGVSFNKFSNDSFSDKKTIKKIIKKRTESEINYFNLQDYMVNIDKINRLSELDSKNLIQHIIKNKDDLFSTAEERHLLEEITKKYLTSKKDKFYFHIEALFHSPLFEIFPFYQLKLDDILNSLLPSKNMEIFKIFTNNLSNTNSYSIIEDEKSDNNGNKNQNEIIETNEIKTKNDIKNNKNKNEISENSENKMEVENYESSESEISNASKNNYYTYNSLIMMEIYNKSDFINDNQIAFFTSIFKNYVLKTLKNKRSTFLPLLIGIFNIKFLGQNKIVILYRNPLYFTNFNNFNSWLHFYLSDSHPKVKSSVSNNEIIGLNQINLIETEDIIVLSREVIDEIKKNIKNDFIFLNSLKFQVYPVLHLFVCNENSLENKNPKKNHLINENNIPNSFGSQRQNSFSVLSNISNISCSLSNISKKLDDYNCLLEKEYYSINGNKDMNTIKIYLSNFFRFGYKKVEDNLLNFECYNNYLQKYLFSHYLKCSSFSSDEKGSENGRGKNFKNENEI